MTYDIIIIGASFSGLTLAHHLPKNLKILILDKKKLLNSLIESTGLITQATKDEIAAFFEVDKYVPNQITTIGVVSTNFENNFFSGTKKPWIYSTDTPTLIQGMSEKLPKNVDLKINSQFITYKIDKNEEYPVKVKLKENGIEKKVSCKFIVGADGSESCVAKANKNLSKNKKFLVAIEKVFYGDILLGDNPDSTVYHFWFGEFSLGYGGWLSPTIINNKKAFRLGLAKLKKDRKELNKVNEFIEILKEKKIINIEKNTKEILCFGHQIPINGPLKKVQDDYSLLIGDAAGFCGAFSADGIKGAVISGKIAAKLIPKHLNGDKKALKTYLQEMEKHNKLITYYKKQLFYRFIWNRMKKNRTYKTMFNLIAKDKEHFINQFCDSKDRQKSLIGIVLKIRNLPLLIKYAWYIFLDLFKIKGH
ncbi:MAG: hypothetical protein UR27_C0007G0083 [Candidatus Peregrinibacteria bacterium GW2011_GWA2_33_10]|nr:MAG: hypothetical protein UR27_C0007G0083 [Candidatus Peregrinibacteria bacterium GW2011_GWA2_33_10]KKP40856.1 MAG: hypothetical protein UR30_C0003G0028 [Candidatus Peregrinibacteria bacterium GW2011_GWC2_33_13]OGJ46912.1 MAG: hypothetical protein A2229_02855 [Candidatus Peregrinibacteria bacterium RIFOXYA2_FULL_33_7]